MPHTFQASALQVDDGTRGPERTRDRAGVRMSVVYKERAPAQSRRGASRSALQIA